MRLKYPLGICALLLASATVAQTGSAGPSEPADVVALLAQMRQAAGGDVWASIKSLHVRSAMTSGGETYAIERREDVLTGRYVETLAEPGVLRRTGYDGLTPWRQARSGIAYALGDVDAALVAADESFRVARAWWFRDRHPATIALVGTRTEGGRSFDILGITPEGGRPFEAWIDHATHLLARTDEQQAEDRVVTTYTDYRAIHGVMLPFTIRTGDGVDASFDEVETVTSIGVNKDVADGTYALPPRPASDIVLPPDTDHVDVPFRLASGNRIIVPVTIDGRVTAEAEFDSGGSLLLQPATVAAAGAVSSGRHPQGGGGEGSITSTAGRLASISIGGATVTTPAFHSFAFRPTDPTMALVGLEVLQRFVVRFDFDRSVMTLTRPDAFRYDGVGAIVPFHFQDNQPEVKGMVDGIAGLFTIDTGDSGSLLLIAPFARRYGLVERYGADIPYDGRAVTATHGVWARKRPATVTLDGADGRPAVAVHDPVTRISLQHAGFDANRDVSANIGIGILRQFNLTFDYPRQRLILEPSHLFGQRDVGNRTGFLLMRDGAAWKVTVVYANSPASEAGLQVGDRLTRIAGKAPGDITDDALSAMLKGSVGEALTLEVASGPSSRSVVLKRRDVI